MCVRALVVIFVLWDGVKTDTRLWTFPPFMERDTRPSKFYAQIDLLIDWEKIETTINCYYTKGNTLKGEKPYNGLLLFKMLLIEIWNGLFDVETEDHLMILSQQCDFVA